MGKTYIKGSCKRTFPQHWLGKLNLSRAPNWPDGPHQELEALLFATRQPLSVSDLSSLVGEEEGAVRKALRQLVKQYSGDGTAMEIRRIGHRYRMALKSEYVELAMPVAEAEMSRSEIDALAYIAKHRAASGGASSGTWWAAITSLCSSP
ncbi:SMC-Scp complex subunit ScpB [Thermogymnomonas acidicola]|uniref:SMC-Scp complex subunit ScpB n=1 Tax=Thermogymnomonas acidicola TaxID=399579 RepID=UPI001396B5FE|nr:SMC-Scp complex subunit ScpB [Thermogymnomonas acidicola]